MAGLKYSDVSKLPFCYSPTLKRTFFYGEFLANILVAVSFFLLLAHLNNIITEIFYMVPAIFILQEQYRIVSVGSHCSVGQQLLFHWVGRFWLTDAGHYGQSNRLQYKLVEIPALVISVV